jgi:hypothetical protein
MEWRGCAAACAPREMMPCRKQKRAARKEASASKKMLHHAPRHAHEEFHSTKDLSAKLSLTTHSLAQQLSIEAAPRRRHFSPNQIPNDTFSRESWHDAGTATDTSSMVLKSSHYAWSTPDKDDYHGDCTGSTLVRADICCTCVKSGDLLASPAALGQHANTDWYETAMHDASSNFSPPVHTRLPAGTGSAGQSSGSLPQAWGVHSHTDYSSDILLPLPPLFDSDREQDNHSN